MKVDKRLRVFFLGFLALCCMADPTKPTSTDPLDLFEIYDSEAPDSPDVANDSWEQIVRRSFRAKSKHIVKVNYDAFSSDTVNLEMPDGITYSVKYDSSRTYNVATSWTGYIKSPSKLKSLNQTEKGIQFLKSLEKVHLYIDHKRWDSLETAQDLYRSEKKQPKIGTTSDFTGDADSPKRENPYFKTLNGSLRSVSEKKEFRIIALENSPGYSLVIELDPAKVSMSTVDMERFREQEKAYLESHGLE